MHSVFAPSSCIDPVGNSGGLPSCWCNTQLEMIKAVENLINTRRWECDDEGYVEYDCCNKARNLGSSLGNC